MFFLLQKGIKSVIFGDRNSRPTVARDIERVRGESSSKRFRRTREEENDRCAALERGEGKEGGD